MSAEESKSRSSWKWFDVFSNCSEGGGRLELLFLSCELRCWFDVRAEEGECPGCGIVSVE